MVFFFALVLILFANSLFNYHRLVASVCKFIVYSRQIRLGLGPSLYVGDRHRMFYTTAYIHDQLVTGEELSRAHRFWYVFLDLLYGI